MAGQETEYGHYRIESGGRVEEGDAWLCNNTTTSGHQYKSGENGDSDSIQAFTSSYGTYYSAHTAKLTTAQRDANAWIVYKYLRDQGWSVNAIAGACGNMQNESRINPGAYEGYALHAWPTCNWGVGLTQWTPNFKLFDWCKENGDLHVYAIESQLARLNYESLNNIQYGRASSYPYGACEPNFTSYRTSTAAPYQLGKNFWYCYERPGNTAESSGNARGRNAEYYYDLFTGEEPEPEPEPEPDPEPTPGKNVTFVGYTIQNKAFLGAGKVGTYFEIEPEPLIAEAQYKETVTVFEQTQEYYDQLSWSIGSKIDGELPPGISFYTGSVPTKVHTGVSFDSIDGWSATVTTTTGSGVGLRGTPTQSGTYIATYVAKNDKANGEVTATITISRKGIVKLLLLFRKGDEDDVFTSASILRPDQHH